LTDGLLKLKRRVHSMKSIEEYLKGIEDTVTFLKQMVKERG
jgi:hypothetical protein